MILFSFKINVLWDFVESHKAKQTGEVTESVLLTRGKATFIPSIVDEDTPIFKEL